MALMIGITLSAAMTFCYLFKKWLLFIVVSVTWVIFMIATFP